MSTEIGSLVVKYVGDLTGLKSANAQVKTLLQSTGAAGKTATSSLSSGLKSASTAASQLTTATKNTTSAVSQMATAASNSSKSLLSGFKNAASGVLDFGNKLGGTITAIRGVADGAIGLGQALLSPAANAEQMQIAFTSLLGSGKAATQMMQTLGNIAVKTPFELPQVQEAAKQLLAFKFNAQDVPNMLLRIGDAVSSVGGGAEGMQRVIVALGQMKLKGKVAGDEMLQLTESNIDAWGYVAKAMGVSTAQAQQMASKGLIPADTAIKAIISGMNEFNGAMDKQSASALGLASTLKDAFNINILANFGKGLLEPLKTSMQGLIALLSNPAISQAASLLGTQIGGALSGLISSFSTLVSKGSGITSFFQQIAQGWQGAFAGSEGAAAVLPGIIAAFGRLQQAVQNFGKVIGPYIGPLLVQFNGLLTTTAGWLASLVAPAIDMLGQRVNALTAFLQPVVAALFPFMTALTNLVNVIGPIVVGVAQLSAQSGLLSVAMGLVGTAVAGVINVLSGIINGISSVIRFFEENQVAAALLASAIGTLAVAFAAFKITTFVQGLAAIAPIMYVLISGAIPGMIAALSGMAVAGWAAIAPFLPFIAIGAAVVAVIAGIILVVRNWGTIVAWLQAQWRRFTGWFTGAINALEKIPGIGAVVTAFKSAWNTISSTAQAAWSNISTNAATALDAIKAKGGEIGNWFQTTWTNISTSAQQQLGPPLNTAWQNISTKAQETTGNIGRFFQDAWNVAKQAWSQSPLSSAFTTTVKAIQAAPGAAGQTLAQGLAPVGQTLGGIGANVQTALGPAVAGVQSGFGNLGASFSQVGQQVSTILKPALDGLNQVLGQIGQMAQGTLVPAWNSLQQAMSQIGTVLSGGFTQAWTTLQQAFSSIG
jgi:tape measure domain-containing protein